MIVLREDTIFFTEYTHTHTHTQSWIDRFKR